MNEINISIYTDRVSVTYASGVIENFWQEENVSLLQLLSNVCNTLAAYYSVSNFTIEDRRPLRLA